jgi:hypothetical protein
MSFFSSFGGWSRRGRHTSMMAALGVDATLRESQVFAVVHRRGDLGTTSSDVFRATGIVMQTITPRWAPLCRKGFVKAKLDSDGLELTRIGHLGAAQIVWYPRERGDPIYERPTRVLERIGKMLPSLDRDELELLYDDVVKLLDEPHG